MSNNIRLPSSSDDPTRDPRNEILCRIAHGKAEIHRALQQILAHTARAATESQVADFERFALQRSIDTSSTWIALAQERGELLWAIIPVTSVGRTMLLFAPTSVANPRQHLAAELLTEAVLAEYTSRDIHLAQVLLEPSDVIALDFYKSLRFQMMAELIYLQTTPKRGAHFPDLPEGFALQNYDAALHDDFTATIASSYDQSLDCPALNGLRSMDDVIAGHKAAGRFDPSHWFLLTKAGAKQGVLLLTQTPGADAMELVYLGLVPEARGQDLGDLLMRQALAVARHQNCSRLTLAVDSLNAPALKLYYRHGLRRIGDKIALMRDLRDRRGQDDSRSTNRPQSA